MMSDVVAELVHGAVGEKVDAYTPVNLIEGVTEWSPHSFTPYNDPELRKRPDWACTGNDNTCGARKANGTEFCAGHLRSRGEL